MFNLKDLSIGKKLALGFGSCVLIIVALVGFNYSQMNSMRVSQDTGAARAVAAIEIMALAEMPVKMYRVTADHVINRDHQGAAREWATLKKELDAELQKMDEVADTKEEKNWSSKIRIDIQEFVQVYEEELLPLLKETTETTDAIKAVDGKIDELIPAIVSNAMLFEEALVDESHAADQEFDKKAAQATQSSLAMLLLGTVVAVLIGVFITRSISQPLMQTVNMIQELGKGHMAMRLRLQRRDEIGRLAETMDQFADDLQNIVIGTMKKIAEGDLSSEVTAKDSQDEITPALKRTIESLRGLVAEAGKLTRAAVEGKLATRGNVDQFKGGYREILQGVNDTLDSVIGPLNVAANYVDRISKGDIPAKITEAYNGDFNTLKSNLNVCIDAVNLLVTDANLLSRAAVEGKLATRADANRHQGDFRKVIEGVNDTLNAVIGPLNMAANYVDKISKGDIPSKIIDTYNGDFNAIKNNLNVCIDAVNLLVGDANLLAKAAVEGRLAARADASKHNGDYRKIIEGVNSTLDSVIGPLNEAAAVLDKVAAKDMTARVKGDYKGDLAKIKDSLNMATENLEKALQQVAIGAEQVASASVQVSTGGQALSQGTSEQASSLEEVSSSLQEMSSMTRQNAANAKEAKGVAEMAKGSADRGVDSMTKLSEAINKIKASSDSTAKIVKTIDEIAFQTNLLALNAAVEAARAGDAGKGFAVVAEEVRNLAMRSAEAAKSTANLIEEAVKNSAQGVVFNAEVLKNLQEINERSNKVSEVVSEIAAASDQQDQGITQVNKAVEQMNQVTQTNAANAEESASAAEEMSSQAEEMRSMIQGFKLTTSAEFTQALRAGSQAAHQLQNLGATKKGARAGTGMQPDPKKIIPLDDKDHDILRKF